MSTTSGIFRIEFLLFLCFFVKSFCEMICLLYKFLWHGTFLRIFFYAVTSGTKTVTFIILRSIYISLTIIKAPGYFSYEQSRLSLDICRVLEKNPTQKVGIISCRIGTFFCVAYRVLVGETKCKCKDFIFTLFWLSKNSFMNFSHELLSIQ